MFIILSIHSNNANSLTNFLKILYKLNKKNFFKLQFYIQQSPKKKKFSFFSVLQSPHVNKKSQEQFERFVYSKQLKIQVCQLTQFLFIWKRIKTKLFFDVKIKVDCLQNINQNNHIIFDKTRHEKFISIFFKKSFFDYPKVHKRRFSKKSKKKILRFSSLTKQMFLKLMDVQGESLLTNFLGDRMIKKI
jgi:ribosomal protein S10